MQSFVMEELGRLIDLIPETDPRSPDYQMLLRSIECLDAMGQTINEIQQARIDEAIREDQQENAKVIPFTAPEFPEEPPDDPMDEAVKSTTVAENATTAPTTEAKTYSSSDVRKALVDARGKGADVKAILAKVGADNFQGVPAAKYGELMDALAEVM